MLVRTGSGKPAPPTRLRQSASPLRVKASVIGPKAVPVRATADKTSGKVGSVKAGEEVTILELQRTPSGTTRVRTQCGWTTAQTKQGRRLLEVDGDLEELLMRDLFRKVDADKDGRLDAAQLERFVASLAPGQPVDPASHAAMTGGSHQYNHVVSKVVCILSIRVRIICGESRGSGQPHEAAGSAAQLLPEDAREDTETLRVSFRRGCPAVADDKDLSAVCFLAGCAFCTLAHHRTQVQSSPLELRN
jgi:hypothetical protein